MLYRLLGYSVLSISCAACTVMPSSAARSLSMDEAEMLAAHNAVRRALDLPEFTWSTRLAAYAKQWSKILATQHACQMQHRTELGADTLAVGENLFWASARIWSDGQRELEPISARQIVAYWVNEQADYNYAANRCRAGAQCGHYTQIVWRDSQVLGCAASSCGNLDQVWVCNYSPAGNWLGQRPY